MLQPGRTRPCLGADSFARRYVEGTLQEEVQSVSVNRTQYTITLDLQVTISMVLDGNTSTAQVSSQIPIAGILLNGETPTCYAAAQ